MWVYAPQDHSRVSNINFDIWIFFCGGGSLNISLENYIKDGKVLTHLVFQSKVLAGPLIDWSAWVGFCTSINQRYWPAFNWLKCLCGFIHLKPTAGSQISTLLFEKKLWRGGLYKYPMKNILRTAKFLPTWDVDQRYCPDFWLTAVPEWVFAPQAHGRVSNINFDNWILFCGGGL